jgi:hypothetical protein
MGAHDPNKGSRNANALAVVAGALIALIAVLAFLAMISHRGGAQEPQGAAGVGQTYAATAYAAAQLTVSVPALAS